MNYLVLFVLPAIALAANKGVLKSDNYPNNYKPNTQKRWIVQATNGNQLNFIFHDKFHTEGAGNACYDYVQILDISAEKTKACSPDAKPIAKFCNNALPPKFTVDAENPSIRSMKAIVEFCSDANVEHEGFFLEWVASRHTSKKTNVAAGKEDQKCGVQAPGNEPIGVNGTDRIVGGIHAKPHSWPWAAAIMPQGDIVYCGGSLINKRWMVTAGHCFADVDEGQWPEFKIKLGADDHGDSGDPNEPSQQVMTIEKAIVNPKYDAGRITHDVTLVKFTEDVKIDDNIIPICLPEKGEQIKGGDNVVTIGWGTTSSGGEESRTLNQVVVPVVDSETCLKAYPDMIDDTMVCAGNLEHGGVDSCQGDSGGALMAHRNDRWELFGIVSWGQGCALPNYPGVYGYVPGPGMLDWILDTLQHEGGGNYTVVRH